MARTAFLSKPLRYQRMSQEDCEDEVDQDALPEPRSTVSQTLWRWIGLVLVAFCAGAIGYIAIAKTQRCFQAEGAFSDTVPRVPIAATRRAFVFNSSFSLPPQRGAESEPIWDSLIPNGLGYITDDELAPEVSMLSVFHQLHCLYTIRRAYYSNAADGQLENFDFGRDRHSHMSHCFDYLRQSLLCAADSSIEPAIDHANGFLGSGFQRQCRSFEEVKKWAEEHRAFDARGFLAKMD